MNCDKCHKPVAKAESAFLLSYVAHGGNPITFIAYNDRHITCSPSRAQYIVHPSFMPVVDIRPDYDKRLRDPQSRFNREQEYTTAWIEIQRVYGCRDYAICITHNATIFFVPAERILWSLTLEEMNILFNVLNGVSSHNRFYTVKRLINCPEHGLSELADNDDCIYCWSDSFDGQLE